MLIRQIIPLRSHRWAHRARVSAIIAAALALTVVWAYSALILQTHLSASDANPSIPQVDSVALPFSASSPWNTPVGTDPRTEPPSSPAGQSLARNKGTVNSGSWSYPVYEAAGGDPLDSVTTPGRGTVHYQIPAGATPAIGSDADMVVVTPDHQFVDECWSMSRTGPTSWTCGYHVRNALGGSGVSAGVRAAGVSSFGGLIRQVELKRLLIPHALAIALAGDQLKMGFVAPANSQDGDAAGSYTGNIPMGSLLIIPPSVDLSTLGLSPQGLAVATALQRYGGYVVDRADQLTLYAGRAAEGPSVNAIRADMGAITAQLRLVTSS